MRAVLLRGAEREHDGARARGTADLLAREVRERERVSHHAQFEGGEGPARPPGNKPPLANNIAASGTS